MAEQEEDTTVLERQTDQGRSPDGSGEAQSAFRPLGVQGGPSFFVPRPGSAENPKDGCHRKSQASLKSSPCLQRNAITSSYSSTRCFPLVERRRHPTTCHTRLPQVLKESEPAGATGSLLSFRVFPEEEPV